MTAPVTLLAGDCLASLDAMPDCSVDAVVTDPPYHLTSIVRRFGASGAAAAKVPEGGTGAYARASRGFMGKEWDGGDIAFRPGTWGRVLRVLKPGGHLVAFNHSRTWHRMAAAIEDAGFEVRDSLLWLYGTGFPKSHDVAAGIDKLRDDRAEVLEVTAWIADARDRAGLTNAVLDAAFGLNGMAGHWTSRKSQPAVPTLAQWARLVDLLGAKPPAEVANLVARLNARKGEPGEATAGPAAEWEGWGTALKPAVEPIVLARKPLAESSVARQVLATGTGAINIDACRIPAEGKALQSQPRKAANGWGAAPARDLHSDRWPANILHDGSREVLDRLPVDGGGSVARFFYSAKADAADRRGSAHPTVKPHALMRWLVRLVCPRGGVVLDPFGGSGATAWAAVAEGARAILCEREPEYLADIARNVRRLAGEIAAAESGWRAEIARLADAAADPAEADRLRKRLDAPHPDDAARAAALETPAGAKAAAAQPDLFGG
jgi:site-specific DNA-methyltransferase (adenine-specific)